MIIKWQNDDAIFVPMSTEISEMTFLGVDFIKGLLRLQWSGFKTATSRFKQVSNFRYALIVYWVQKSICNWFF